jgi:predicted ArsR family transcriptional regulator
MENNTDIKTMKLNGDYFTVQEMSRILGESTNTIKKRILRLGIKATVKYALYSSSDLEKIKNVTMGRPKKESKPAPDKKPTKKARKPKK